MATLIESETVNDAFVECARRLHHDPDHVVSPRGQKTKELLGVAMEVTHPTERLVKNIHRKMSLKYLVGEWLWYARGSNSLSEIEYYSKFWAGLSEDKATAESAYGYRIRGRHPAIELDQWEYAKRQLLQDTDSRRAVLMISLPSDLRLDSLDLPCTQFLQFAIRDGKLFLFACMRSNDLIYGLTYDMPCFTLFQERMLLELRPHLPGLMLGSYFHYASSLHVYQRHFGMIEQVARDPHANLDVSMPRMRDANQLDALLRNEERIRGGHYGELEPLTDEFCGWCNTVLLDGDHEESAP